MQYEGRLEAGRLLAAEVCRLGLGPCVVAGLLPGGIVVAEPIAQQLCAPLVPLETRMLSSPQAPEWAFGAIDEDGRVVLDYRAMVTLGLGTADVDAIKDVAMEEIARRRASLPGQRLVDLLPGRTAILVEDGLAAGLRMQAAVAYAQRHGATATVVAVPCASDRASYELASVLSRPDDRLVCPLVDPGFRAVSDCYREFPDVPDVEVARILEHTASTGSP